MMSHHHNIDYHTKIKSVLKGFCLSDTLLSIIWKQATFSLIDSIIILIKISSNHLAINEINPINSEKMIF